MSGAEIAPAAIGLLVVLAAVAYTLLPLLSRNVRAPSLEPADDRARQRFLLYRQVLEAEFDLQTGKLTPQDYQALSGDLLRQAAAFMTPLEGAATTTPDDLELEVEREIAAARQALLRIRSDSAVAAAR